MKAKLIYDFHEIYTETLNQFFPKNPPFFKKPIFDFSLSAMRFLGEREEKKLLYSVDHFITVGEGLKIYFTKKYGFADIKVVMNCPSLDTITTKAVDLHSLLKIAPGQFIVIYQGTLNQGRGLDTLIKAFSEVDKHISLVILGDGPFLDYLVQLTTQLGLEDRVYFPKSVPLEELAGYTKGADIGISLQDAASTLDGTSFLMKRGLGTLVLNGNNSQTGIYLADGVLQVNGQTSLGNPAEGGASAIQFGNDQTLGGATTGTRYTGGTLRLNFTGTTNRGVAFNNNGNTNFSGGIDATAGNAFTTPVSSARGLSSISASKLARAP